MAGLDRANPPSIPETPVIEIEKPRRTGCRAFAGHDNFLWSSKVEPGNDELMPFTPPSHTHHAMARLWDAVCP
jgi:hypothetical protein